MKLNTMISSNSSMHCWLRRLLAFSLCLASAGSLWAQLTIDLPEITVPAGGSTTFDVFIKNGGADRTDITGIAFQIQSADGGTAAGGSVNAPTFSAVDVVTGTIFKDNNEGNQGPGPIVPQLFEQQTTTTNLPNSTPSTVTISNGTSPGSKIASVTVNAAGFSSGTYSMTLNTLNGATKFNTSGGDLTPLNGLTLIDGSITVVPEPNAALAIAGVLFGVAMVVRWKRASA